MIDEDGQGPCHKHHMKHMSMYEKAVFWKVDQFVKTYQLLHRKIHTQKLTKKNIIGWS